MRFAGDAIRRIAHQHDGRQRLAVEVVAGGRVRIVRERVALGIDVVHVRLGRASQQVDAHRDHLRALGGGGLVVERGEVVRHAVAGRIHAGLDLHVFDAFGHAARLHRAAGSVHRDAAQARHAALGADEPDRGIVLVDVHAAAGGRVFANVAEGARTGRGVVVGVEIEDVLVAIGAQVVAIFLERLEAGPAHALDRKHIRARLEAVRGLDAGILGLGFRRSGVADHVEGDPEVFECPAPGAMVGAGHWIRYRGVEADVRGRIGGLGEEARHLDVDRELRHREAQVVLQPRDLVVLLVAARRGQEHVADGGDHEQAQRGGHHQLDDAEAAIARNVHIAVTARAVM
jgi:hypothetical protein